MHVKKVTFRADKFPLTEVYPFKLASLQRTPGLEFDSPVTFFVGENGSGKSTVLKAICRKCDIHIWKDASTLRYRPNPFEDELYQYLDVEWAGAPAPGSFFASEIFQDFARYLDEWAKNDPGMLQYFGGQSLLTQSHGESLMSFFRGRYGRPGLYLLDEPETALSPKTQLELLRLLGRLEASLLPGLGCLGGGCPSLQ